MATLTCLAMSLHLLVISEALGIQESFVNTSGLAAESQNQFSVNDTELTDNLTERHMTTPGADVLGSMLKAPSQGRAQNRNSSDLNETVGVESGGLVRSNLDILPLGGLLDKTPYGRGGEFQLPVEWLDFCRLGEGREYSSEFTPAVNLTEIICHVTPQYSGIWSMKDLRFHLYQYESLNLKYSVDIRCHGRSNVSVSWPMKVANLYSLSVSHCNITGWLDEFNETLVQTTPDSLRVISFSDNTVLTAIDVYINLTKNFQYIQSEYNCGHEETVETMSMKYQAYAFVESNDFVIEKLTELGQQFILDAKRSPIKCDFKHLMYLYQVDIPSMSIYHNELGDSIFYELRVYNLSYNHISTLKDRQRQWSLTYPKLEVYDLSHNAIDKLYRFEIPLRTNLDKVTTINLQHNKINSFSVEDLDRFQQMPMVFIDIRNNPIHCNCSENMKQLLSYIKQERYVQISNVSDYSYIKDFKCALPARLQSRTLESIIDTDLLCPSDVEKEYFLVPILVLSGAIVILSIILFALLRYRKEVLIILFTRFNIIVPCQQRHFNDSDKKFDAFVSYSSKEEEWVESVFENLELQLIDGSRPFRFCLHHRDFIPGRTIYDNVIHSVESSRHTIIVLSNNFLKSEFCLYEFQEAFRQSIMEQKRHLVIVMMEELEPTKVPRDLRRCIQTFTYIRKDDYLFRERLIYALSVRQKMRIADKSRRGKSSSSKSKRTSADKSSPKGNISSGNITLGKTSNSNGTTAKTNKNSFASEITPQSISMVTASIEMTENEQSCCNDKGSSPHSQSNLLNSQSSSLNSLSQGVEHKTSVRKGMKNISAEKNLALSIDKDSKPPMHESTCDAWVATELECVGGDVCTEMPVMVAAKRSEYDRSISTVSRDTGYFSEKGSPDICSHTSDEFDKHIFSDEIDIPDFVV